MDFLNYAILTFMYLRHEKTKEKNITNQLVTRLSFMNQLIQRKICKTLIQVE